MISLANISKKFGNFVAISDISFNVKEGEVFGLLGPNGAGKSTMVKILCTILEPTTGNGVVKEFDLRQDSQSIRRIVGYLPEEPRVYDYMTAYEYLKLFASMYSVSDDKIIDLMQHFDVIAHKDRLMGDLSKGLRQRTSICRALLHDPEILILDEPTMGLDPASARELRDKIMDLKKHGKTIIICTHYMEEADFLCDRVAIVSNGRIVGLGTPEELKAKVKSKSEIGVIFSDQLLAEKLIVKVPRKGRAFVFTGKNYDEILKGVLVLSGKKSMGIEKIFTIEPTLEDVFVSLVGKSPSEVGK